LFRVLTLIALAGFAIETGIYYLLAALGASGDLAVAIEMIWLCAFVVIGCTISERFFPEDNEPGDDPGSHPS
jgi:hypothetical protein